ncbi:MAG: hypothetical protein PVG07_12045 [Acidobacteriota bacterium]|jgi:hypothetical protein
MRSERPSFRLPFLDPSIRTRSGLPAAAAIALLALLGPLACGGGDGPPVAVVRVEPREVTLAHSTVTDLQLGWDLTSDLGEHSGEPRVFVHLLDERGRLTRTFDHPLPGGWAEGERREYSVRIYQSALAPPLPPGSYTLTLGLYDAAGTRWPLDVEGEPAGEREYTVARVTVPSGPAEVPELGFSPGWSPTLAGGDRQILALRWLTGNGALLVDEPSGTRVLWMQLHIPSAEAEGVRRIYRSGAGEPELPRVRVVSPCSGFEAFLTGPGSHEVSVPVAESEERNRCVVRLEPNYAMVADGVEQETVMLQNLAWEQAPAPRDEAPESTPEG